MAVEITPSVFHLQLSDASRDMLKAWLVDHGIPWRHVRTTILHDNGRIEVRHYDRPSSEVIDPDDWQTRWVTDSFPNLRYRVGAPRP